MTTVHYVARTHDALPANGESQRADTHNQEVRTCSHQLRTHKA